MKAARSSRREQNPAMLADLKMPGALEASDSILGEADRGVLAASGAMSTPQQS